MLLYIADNLFFRRFAWWAGSAECGGGQNLEDQNKKNDLRWDIYISDVTKRTCGRLFMFSMLKRPGLCFKGLVTVYVGFIHPRLEYALPLWHPELALSWAATSIVDKMFKL